MGQYVGLDVSLKETSICVMDGEGTVLHRATVPTDAKAVEQNLVEHSFTPDRIVHESGLLSIWLQRGFLRLGLPAVCIDARLAHKALSAKLNKSDRADAEGLAHLARTGWYTEVHIRSEAADRLRTLITARERLVRLRKDLEAHIRGVLKTFGIRMSDIGQGRLRARFREQLAVAGEADPSLAMIADGFCAVHETLCVATDGLTDDLKRIAKESSLTQRLMTVPGVGPIVALNFVALIDRSGRVSKCGDSAMRGLLFEAASCLISQVKRFSSLKSWAVRLAGRKGFKKAAVATARKIAVLLLTIWKDGTEFQWTKEATA